MASVTLSPQKKHIFSKQLGTTDVSVTQNSSATCFLIGTDRDGSREVGPNFLMGADYQA
jgi:hypothetical protein